MHIFTISINLNFNFTEANKERGLGIVRMCHWVLPTQMKVKRWTQYGVRCGFKGEWRHPKHNMNCQVKDFHGKLHHRSGFPLLTPQLVDDKTYEGSLGVNMCCRVYLQCAPFLHWYLFLTLASSHYEQRETIACSPHKIQVYYLTERMCRSVMTRPPKPRLVFAVVVVRLRQPLVLHWSLLLVVLAAGDGELVVRSPLGLAPCFALLSCRAWASRVHCHPLREALPRLSWMIRNPFCYCRFFLLFFAVSNINIE